MDRKVYLYHCAGSTGAVVRFFAKPEACDKALHGLETAGKTRLQDVRS